MTLDPVKFRSSFAEFERLVAMKDHGHRFTNFREGLAAAWEDYKPRLYNLARELLEADAWQTSEIGTGSILHRTIAAIEIDVKRINLNNNLVSWENRYGHASRDHRVLLEAQQEKKARSLIEGLLFELYRGRVDSEQRIFDQLSETTGRKYPLMAYLFFLKDMNRFLPIHPTGFDRAFRALDIEFVTLRQCGWLNYVNYNALVGEVRAALETTIGLNNVRLIDAHSFCWILATLLRFEEEGKLEAAGKDAGRILGARERSILDLKYSIIQTAQQARGQTVQRTTQVKLKNLDLNDYELEKHIRDLMKLQEDRCALTGIPFQFKDIDADSNLLPSPDRIDSDGHYEIGNIQVVCQFVNYWKRATPNDEFIRLLTLVRGVGRGREGSAN
jgi:hypothetical protein